MNTSIEKQLLKKADDNEKALRAILVLLGVQFKGPRCFEVGDTFYRVHVRKCRETAPHFGGPRRAIRLLRLFHFIKHQTAKPANSHWWGAISPFLIAIAQQFPALKADVWAIENGCDYHAWMGWGPA